MEINLVNIQPNRLSRNITDYVWGIYGSAGIGKTTMASKFDKALIVAFEKGYLALPNVMAQDVSNWRNLKSVIKQLKDSEVKQMFKFVFIDTADIAWHECEKYICSREGVDKISDVPYGGGYKMLEEEFFDTLKSIIAEGYGLGWLSHSEYKTIKHEGLEEYQKITTTLPNKARKVLFGMSDIVVYAKSNTNEQGEEIRTANVRTNSKHEAKSRFSLMKENFIFDYDTLVEEFNKAIDLEEAKGSKVVDKVEKSRYEKVDNSAEELNEWIEKIKELGKQKRAEGVKLSLIKEICPNPTEIESIEKAKEIYDSILKIK